jgi:Tol biopolymer transport system component
MRARHAFVGGVALTVVMVAGCAGEAESNDVADQETGLAFNTPASTTVHEPMAGEVHLANIRQLTFGGNNAEAYFSKDGTRLIFQRQDSVSTGCDQEYVMNIDGSDMRRISNGKGRTTCGYFIESDARVIYASTQAHAAACPARPDDSMGYVWPLGHLELYTANPDGSDTRQVTDNGAYNAEATASPDGSRVIFTSTMDGDVELYTMNVDGSDIRRVTDRVGYDGGAFFSPDGSKIVWRAQYPETVADSADYLSLLAQRVVRPSHLELWVADADGSNPRQITNLGGANFAPIFHPDGKRIIWSSNHTSTNGRTFELNMMNLDGTGLEQITFSDDFNAFPMFSPDGSKLVFASNRHGAEPRETNLFIADWVE